MQLQHVLDGYWSQRAQAYFDNQTSSDKALKERELWREAFVSVVPSAPSRILDVGTGPGYLANLLAEEGHDVTGIDTSQGMLKQAMQDRNERMAAGLPVAHFQQGDAVAPSGDFRGVDVVVSRYLLWTLRDPDVALSNWINILAPGGWIIAADANHHPYGITAQRSTGARDGTEKFQEAYADTHRDLPLSDIQSPQPYIDLFHAAGLTDVQLTPLPKLLEHKRKYGASPNHEIVEPFLIVGKVPA